MLARVAVFALIGSATLLATQGARQPAATGVIEGRVIDAGTGQALAGVFLRLRQSETTPGAAEHTDKAVTNTAGRFEFANLPASAFVIEADAPGSDYLGGAFGKRRPDGYPLRIKLAAGERWSDATIELFRAGSIAGRLTDDDGRPLGEQWISAWPIRAGTQRHWGTYIPNAKTDKDGNYRFTSLAPDTYIVAAMIPRWVDASTNRAQFPRELLAPRPTADGQRRVFRSTFFGQSREVSGAIRVAVASGQRREGVDIELIADVPAVVSGRVIRETPFPRGSDVELRLPGVPSNAAAEARAMIAEDGRFVIADIGPGSYIAHPVPKSSSGDSTMIISGDDLTEIPIEVPSTGLSNLEWNLTRGFKLSVRLRFEGPGPYPRYVDGLLLPLDDGAVSRGNNHGDQLDFEGVMPGRYFLGAQDNDSKSPWHAKRTLLNGKDVTGDPIVIGETGTDLEVVMSAAPTRMSNVAGSVQDSSGRPVPDSTVVMFPADPAQWTFGPYGSAKCRAIRVLRGAFDISSVPPGEYYIAAVDERTMSGWPDATLMERFAPRAKRIVVERERSMTVSLEILK